MGAAVSGKRPELYPASSSSPHRLYLVMSVRSGYALFGYPLEPEAIAALSPDWTHFVNRLGVYALKLDRCPPTLNVEAPSLPTATS